MATKSVYEYKDYKLFVLERLAQLPNEGRGRRKDLAAAMGCQAPFISHVLSGDYDLSAEQAEACGRWLKLGEEDLEFFLLLVLYNRAATKPLERMLSRQITKRRERHSLLKEKVEIKASLTIEDQLVYCSSWHYAAVHMALLNPKCQTAVSLQAALGLSAERIEDILQFLTRKQLVKTERELFQVNHPFLHFALGSPLLPQHHTNWRLKAIESLSEAQEGDLHYSASISLSKDDFEWVGRKLSSLLAELATKVKSSPDEQLAVLAFDWFRLGHCKF